MITAQLCEFDAYSCLLKQKLLPAMVLIIIYEIKKRFKMEMFWLDKINFNTITHSLYTSKITFPYSLYYVEKRRKHVQTFVDSFKKSKKDIVSDAIQANKKQKQ